MESDQLDALNRWRTALEREVRLRGHLNMARANGKASSGEDLRQWWSAAEGVWREFSRQVASGHLPDPQPAELAAVTEQMFGYLAVGRLPDPMRDALSEGRHKPGPQERWDIELAVAYHRAAKGGLEHNGQRITIADKTPTKTISSHYGVAAATARQWFRQHPPAFLGVNNVNAETLVALMKAAARRYRIAGRSAKAISSRNAKRQPNP